MSDVGYSTYNAGYVKKSLENTFTDVTAIGKYVVTVGYSNLFGVDVRVFDKNHPFQPSGIQSSIYQVSGIPSFGYYQWNEVDALITSVPDLFPCNKNNISIASIFRTVFGDMSTNWTINLVELDVNSIVSHNPTAIVNSRNLSSLHYYSPLKLRELRYNPYNRRHSILYQGTNNDSLNAKNIFVEISDNYDSVLFAFRDLPDDYYSKRHK